MVSVVDFPMRFSVPQYQIQPGAMQNHPREGLKQHQRMTSGQNHQRAVLALMFFIRAACHWQQHPKLIRIAYVDAGIAQIARTHKENEPLGLTGAPKTASKSSNPDIHYTSLDYTFFHTIQR